ncbi:hypothetical protein COO60DRAFT_1640633 [Scenedesmus sp. NREL 46B-D3]|nr:hypothetical protein COO60DRAFT_1640633 [Scenedesmus sp. NREL 46B-D3]
MQYVTAVGGAIPTLFIGDVWAKEAAWVLGNGGVSASSCEAHDSLTACEVGDFKYKPRAGDALRCSTACTPTAAPTRVCCTAPGACPVRGRGENWVATKWLHDKPIDGWEGGAESGTA